MKTLSKLMDKVTMTKDVTMNGTQDGRSRWTRMAMMVVMAMLTVLAGMPPGAEAAAPVTVLQNWSQLNASGAGTATTLNVTNQQVSAGNRRIYLLAVAAEYSAAVTSFTVTATLNGVPVNELVSDSGISARGHLWVGYILEADIPAGSGTLALSGLNGTGRTGLRVWSASYQDVDQGAPFGGSGGNYNAATSVTFGADIPYVDGGQLIFAAINGGSPATLTGPAGFTQNLIQTGTSGFTMFAASKTSTSGGGQVAGTDNVTFGGTTSSRSNVVVFSLNPRLCEPTDGPVVVAPGGAVAGNPVNVCDLFTTNGAALSNLTIKNGATTYYNGTACANLPTTTVSGAPVNWVTNGALALTVTANDSCGDPIVGNGSFAYDSCVASTGPIAVNSGILSGTTTDVTALISNNGATLNTVKVYEIVGAGSDVNHQESFGAGGNTGWGNTWTATLADGVTPQAASPGNGDLMTGLYTRTTGTGPTSAPAGDFLYYESSMGAGTDRYLVHSTLYDAAQNQLGVKFSYNMNGANVGTLALQVRNPNYNGNAWTTEWTRSGNQNNSWRTVSVDLYNGGGASATTYRTGSTQVRFKFTYGGGPLGDIAIDSVDIYGPRGVNPVALFNGTAAQAQTASTAGWPEAAIRIDVTGTDNCGGSLSDVGYAQFRADFEKPVVTSFAMPATSLSPVSIYSFMATDNLAVTGYKITEVSTAPLPGAAGWSATAPVKVSATAGARTFYAWAKDGAGNVSLSRSQAVTVNPDVNPPTVTTFVLPASSFSPITITSLSATDDSGVVAGYLVTTSATPPLATDPGWTATAPATLSAGGSGSTTFYAWAKDSSGNVSASLMKTVDVKVDTFKPVVSFLLPATHNALTVPVSTFTAVDTSSGAANNTGVVGYKITTSATPPLAADSGWTGAPVFQVTVPAAGSHTFWGWAKDGAGNVSNAVSSTVTVTLPTSCKFDVNPAGTLIQTENYTSMGAPAPWAWDTILTPLADASGDLSVGGYLITAAGGTGASPNGSRADYPVFFPTSTAGNWCIWIRGLDQSGLGGGDSNFWGVDGSYVGAMTQTADNQWAWTNTTQNGAKCTNITVNGQDSLDPDGAGPLPAVAGQWHTINLWPREMGQKNDMFYLIRDTSNNALGAFTGTNDQTTVLPLTAHSVIDPTCVDSSGGGAPGGGGAGGGGNYIHIPDGQSHSGSPLAVQAFYTSNMANPLQYRPLGPQSDGFEHNAVDAKWNHTNIGNEPLLVDTVPMVEGQGYFKLAGSGADIWGTGDFFAYHYQGGVSGDFTIDVQMKSLVDRQTNTTTSQNTSAKAGIMVRQSLANNSRNVMMLVTSGNGSRLQARAVDGGTTAYINTTSNGVTAGANTWLRLRRTGNLFEGFHSIDGGRTWVSVGTTTVNMTGAVNIGLGVTSHNTARDSVGSFDNFLVMPAGKSSMSESWTSTATALNTTLTSPWTAGEYAIAVRDSAATATQVNTFSYDPCIDTTPSALAVYPGQHVGGGAVSLSSLFSHTGNVGTFRYQINGNDVSNPWNSYALVPDTTSAVVNFSVRGTDNDCGGKDYSASGTIVVDNTCNDPSPSTLTILTGQTTGGASVDLTKLFTSTGNVAAAGLTFKINGEIIGTPQAWDSRAYGTVSAQAVNFEVSGIDPECGNHLAATNALGIDNACVQNKPSITIDQHEQYVGAGRAIPIQVTIRNEDSFNCAPSTFTIAVDSETENEAGDDFAPSSFTGSTSVLLQGRQSATFELAVRANGGATEWHSVDTTLKVTSDGGHTPNTDTVKTTVFLVSPITHNAITTHSSKWGGSKGPDGETATLGKWGTSQTGSKYGNFTCETCHQKDAHNIKWMRENITLPDSTQWGGNDSTPITRPVQFKDARDGSPEWGNDLGGRVGSTRSCEVCHSTTLYHRFDTNQTPPQGGVGPQAELGHFNNRDCTDCHRHSLGFTASCTGCHGNPPLDSSLGGPNGLANIPSKTGSTTPGTHYKHVVVLKYPCTYCHANYRGAGEMPKEAAPGFADINHTFNVFPTTPARTGADLLAATAGHYTGQDGVYYEGVKTPLGQGTMSCENIYCHGGTENMGGSNPQWNGNIACNSCHGTSPTNTPPGYSHTTHVGKLGQACSYCHGTDPVPGSNGHVNGKVHVDLSGLAATAFPSPNARYRGEASWNSTTLAPSPSYGSCTNVACHLNTPTPVWNSGPATCTTCHNNGTTDGVLEHAAPLTGNHDEHVHPTTPAGIKMIGAFVNQCESCHGGGANTGHHSGHLNGKVEVGGGMSYNSGNGTCTSLCHSLKGALGNVSWGSTDQLSCQACHVAPYIGPTVLDPDNEGTGMNAAGFGSHLGTAKNETFNSSTNWNTQCRKCHPYHEGGVTVPLPPNSSSHVGLPAGTNMQERLGLQYTITGGIHLGGTATSGGTEAELCWNCHGLDTEINEWGFNIDTNGASFPVVGITPDTTGISGSTLPGGHIYWAGAGNVLSNNGGSYNYGYLYSNSTYTTATSAWVDASGKGMYRRDGYQHLDTKLSKRIASVHSADFTLAANPGSSVLMNVNGSGVVGRTDGAHQLETPDKIRCTYCHDVHGLNRALDSSGNNETATGRPYLRGTWAGNPYGPDMPPQSGYSYGTNYFTSGQNNGGISGMPRLYADARSRGKGGYFIDKNSNYPTKTAAMDTLDETAGVCVGCHGSNVDGMDYYTGSTLWRTGTVNGHSNSTIGGTGLNKRDLFDARRGTGRYMSNQDQINQQQVRGPWDNRLGEGRYVRNTGWYGGTLGGTNTTGSDYTAWFSAGGIGKDPALAGNKAHNFTCSKCHSPHATGLPALLITNCLDKGLASWTNNVGTVNPSINQSTNCHRKEGTTTGWNKLAVGQ